MSDFSVILYLMRRELFSEGEFYHLFNHGVDDRNIVLDKNDSERFLISLKEFNTVKPIGSIIEKRRSPSIFATPANQIGHRMSDLNKPLVSIICYCLNPNHFHLLVEQKAERCIEKFMQKLQNGFTKF